MVSGAQACVLAFSTVDRDSFEAVESWKRKVLLSFFLMMFRLDKMKYSAPL